ncbi:MAG TPA: VCBS repeat-containing protein, partial [Xanthomonadales bacterium]|nr:VCBS repeat-containing protein [Xanthomonadales bacterium]
MAGAAQAALTRHFLLVIFMSSSLGCSMTKPTAVGPLSVAATPSNAVAPDGQFISWAEHRIDDELLNGGIPLRGGDGLAMGDIDRDGFEDIASVHEDSNHLRLAFGTGDPGLWERLTLGEGTEVGAIEDVAIGDLNGDGWPDLVAACENAHLIYFQNPGHDVRSTHWQRIIPGITQGRGSWLRVFMAYLDLDGRLDVLAPNKGSADIIDPSTNAPIDRPTSVFFLDGDPLQPSSWREQVLFSKEVPNTAMPVDIDNDGDLDVLAAERLAERLTILEVTGASPGRVAVQARPIAIVPGFDIDGEWSAFSGAIQSAFADLDGDGRQDLVAGFREQPGPGGNNYRYLGLGWLRQPASLDQPWTYFRIGDTLPDIVVGISLADIDGDGDLDAMTGGYSGLNLLTGAYSGASRQEDDPHVTAASTVGRLAWFENPGDARVKWNRHDISRRVRGMYD